MAPPDQRFFYLEADIDHIDGIASSIKSEEPFDREDNSYYLGGPMRRKMKLSG